MSSKKSIYLPNLFPYTFFVCSFFPSFPRIKQNIFKGKSAEVMSFVLFRVIVIWNLNFWKDFGRWLFSELGSNLCLCWLTCLTYDGQSLLKVERICWITHTKQRDIRPRKEPNFYDSTLLIIWIIWIMMHTLIWPSFVPYMHEKWGWNY